MSDAQNRQMKIDAFGVGANQRPRITTLAQSMNPFARLWPGFVDHARATIYLVRLFDAYRAPFARHADLLRASFIGVPGRSTVSRVVGK